MSDIRVEVAIAEALQTRDDAMCWREFWDAACRWFGSAFWCGKAKMELRIVAEHHCKKSPGGGVAEGDAGINYSAELVRDGETIRSFRFGLPQPSNYCHGRNGGPPFRDVGTLASQVVEAIQLVKPLNKRNEAPRPPR